MSEDFKIMTIALALAFLLRRIKSKLTFDSTISTMPGFRTLLFILYLPIAISSGPSIHSGDAQICRDGSITGEKALQCDLLSRVLKEIHENKAENPLGALSNIEEAVHDFSGEKGEAAYKFLRGLASSRTFLADVWHQQPLLIRARDTAGWVEGAFTIDPHLKMIDNSYITGHKTAEILRNGTKTDTWAFVPLKNEATRPTTWKEVDEALQGGTIYFNTAGSLWPNLGGLCRLTTAAFGLPSNVNVYVTPSGMTLSVPLHTDRQDVFVLQTQGAKRWRIYAPPSRENEKDPMNRGKAGDILSFEELGEPLIDTVIRRGDVLYVPAGFPHTTDTCTLVDFNDTTVTQAHVFDETSVHLTMGLDTHVWGLTIAHLRWSLLQRCEKSFKLDMKDDELYWKSMESLPVGFVGGDGWIRSIDSLRTGGALNPTFRQEIVDNLKEVMILLEPTRWRAHDSLGSDREEMPSDSDCAKVVDYMFTEHLPTLFLIHEEMFSNIKPRDDSSVIKAFHCTRKQNAVMESFGAFSNSAAMEDSFAQRRLHQEQKLSNA
jgi:hypothetical protein